MLKINSVQLEVNYDWLGDENKDTVTLIADIDFELRANELPIIIKVDGSIEEDSVLFNDIREIRYMLNHFEGMISKIIKDGKVAYPTEVVNNIKL
jgi:hypothetical protein